MWRDVEASVQTRQGWKREGRAWRGPCPVTSEGKDTCSVKPKPNDPENVWVICGVCGGRLESAALREHLDALCGPAPVVPDHFPGTPRRRRPQEPRHAESSSRHAAAAAWREAGPVDGTPGRVYLVGRGVWSGTIAAVRWLPRAAARRLNIRPSLPPGTAGVLVYRYAAPDEGETLAVQMEAVDGEGRPRDFCIKGKRSKRPAVTASEFDHGRRVFTACLGDSAGVWLCEGPLDAMALLALELHGALDLGGATVLGAPGTSGFCLAAVAGVPGPVTLAAQDDRPSVLAAVKLGGDVRRGTGRTVRIRRPKEGLTGCDWADAAALEAAEREAIKDE